MAEVIGLVASIASLLQIATQITHLSYRYFSDIRDAPKTQKLYLQEVSAFIDVLFRLEQALLETEAAGLVPPRPTSLNEDIIKDCSTQLYKLQTELEKRTRRTIWPFHEKELRRNTEVLARFRSIFADFISANILNVTNATHSKLEGLTQEYDKQQLVLWLRGSDSDSRSRPNPCPGTGQWFLECPEFRDWRTEATSILWVCGPPGVGKSQLASLVVDNLQAANSAPIITASFFCEFSSRQKQKPITILKSLLLQIVEQSDAEVALKVKEACADDLSRLGDIVSLSSILAEICSLRSIYLVIDAPDELDKPNELLKTLKSLCGASCKLLITSREISEMKRHFKEVKRLDIHTEEEDIRRYLKQRFEDIELYDKIVDTSKVIEDVISKSGKIFLVAKLIMDQISEQQTIRQMRKLLESFDSTIDGMYQANLRRIDAQPATRKTLARRLLGWITHARRRFRVQEILEAFAIEEDDEEIDPENILNEAALVTSCMGFVVINMRDRTLDLIHASAYGFFRDETSIAQSPDLDISWTCLRYMSLKPFREGPCKNAQDMATRFQKMNFLNYSTNHFGDHASVLEVESDLTSRIIKFLVCDNLRNNAFQAFQFRLEITKNIPPDEEFLASIPTGQSALHLAACWGLAEAVKLLIETGAEKSSLDSQLWTPLHYACAMNQLKVASILIQAGSDLDKQDSQGWTPLFWATFSGNYAIVELLLEKNADHLLPSKLGWTALHWAVAREQEDIVKLLLTHHVRCHGQSPSRKRRVADLSYDEAVRHLQQQPQASVAPLEVAAEMDRPQLFDILAHQIATTPLSLTDESFNKIWTQQAFPTPVANPWRTLTKAENFDNNKAVYQKK